MTLSARFRTLAVLLALGGVLSAGRAGDETATAEDSPSAPEPAAVTSPTFLHSGESLGFKLGWGILSRAGETRIETRTVQTPEGPRLKVTVVTRSKGIVDTFYPLSSDSISLIDPTTGRTLSIQTTGKEGDRTVNKTTVFDYAKGEVVHTDAERPGRSGTVKLPDTPIYDLMVTLMRAREWNMKAGDKRRVQCIVDKDIYDLELEAVEEERIKTPAGKFDTVVLQPRQLGEQKGIFRKGGSMRFWISKGENPQLVRFDLKAGFGTISTTLESIGKVKADADTPVEGSTPETKD